MARQKLDKPLRGQNTELRMLGRTQEQRGDELGRSERTIQRWDKEDRERKLLECLQTARYPAVVIDRTISAVNGEKRTFETYGDYNERSKELRQELREPEAIADRWPGDQLERYINTIIAAEIVDDFEVKFIQLAKDHPSLDDYMADLELTNLIGMRSEEKEAWVIQRSDLKSVSN